MRPAQKARDKDVLKGKIESGFKQSADPQGCTQKWSKDRVFHSTDVEAVNSSSLVQQALGGIQKCKL